MYKRKYSRDERKKLHKAIFGISPSRTFTDWNRDFSSCGEAGQDGIWEMHFPKKIVTPPASNYWPYTFEFVPGEDRYVEDPESKYFSRVNVIHIPSGKTTPGMSTSGGGPEFDLWHNTPIGIFGCFGPDERNQKTLVQEWIKNNQMRPLDCCTTPIPVVNRSWEIVDYIQPTPVFKKKPQESVMNRYEAHSTGAYANAQVAAAKTDTTIQREHLLERLNGARYDKQGEELRRAFGLEDDEAPKTIKERKERFAAGKYIIQWKADEDDYDEDEEIGSYYTGGKLRWRDPAVKEDRKGFNLAVDKIEKDVKHTKDIIVIKSPDDGLKALEKFESSTFH